MSESRCTGRGRGVRRIAVVYHFFSHYREPIMRELAHRSADDLEYTFVSDQNQTQPGQWIMSPEKGKLPLSEGGLPWRFIKNRWLTPTILWQSGVVRHALSGEFDTLIMLGAPQFLSSWVTALLARLRGKRILMWGPGAVRSRGRLRSFARGIFWNLAHGHLLYSHRGRANHIRMGQDPRTLYVVFNSLDHDLQTRMREQLTPEGRAERRQELFSHPEDPVVIFTGRLMAHRGLDWLVRAAAEMGERGHPVNLLFVGDGPERGALEQLATERGIADRLVLFGPCYDERVLAELYSLSEVCVGPGSLGLTVMHAFVYGVPCITHDDGGQYQGAEFESIVPGVTGALFPHGDYEAFVRTLEGWITDPPDRETVRAACQRMVDLYYNPAYQVRIFDAAVRGVPATELDMGEADFAHILGADASA